MEIMVSGSVCCHHIAVICVRSIRLSMLSYDEPSTPLRSFRLSFLLDLLRTEDIPAVFTLYIRDFSCDAVRHGGCKFGSGTNVCAMWKVSVLLCVCHLNKHRIWPDLLPRIAYPAGQKIILQGSRSCVVC